MEWIDSNWFELCGLFIIFFGSCVVIKRKVSFGYEFEEPKLYLHGKAAILIGITIIIGGIWLISNSTDLKINQCLEKGFGYSHESGKCE